MRAAPAEVLHTLDEVAEMWRCGRSTVLRLVARGELRAVNIGTGRPKLRVPASALAEFVTKKRVA